MRYMIDSLKGLSLPEGLIAFGAGLILGGLVFGVIL